MAAAITLRFTYTRAEIVGGLRWSAWQLLRRKSKGIAIASLTGMLAILTLSLAERGNIASTVAAILATPISLYLLLAAHAYYIRPLKAFQSQPAYKGEVMFHVTDHGITMRGIGFNRSLKWDYYARVHEDEKQYLLVTPDLLVMVVPKRVFADSEESARFRQMLRERVGEW